MPRMQPPGCSYPELSVAIHQLLKHAVVVLQVVYLDGGNHSHLRPVAQKGFITFISLCHHELPLAVLCTRAEGGEMGSDQDGRIKASPF